MDTKPKNFNVYKFNLKLRKIKSKYEGRETMQALFSRNLLEILCNEKENLKDFHVITETLPRYFYSNLNLIKSSSVNLLSSPLNWKTFSLNPCSLIVIIQKC